MSIPVVSIITATYNHEKFIQECIRSVQAQSFQQWEMIIVDDGSTDNTKSLADEIAATDSRIRVIHQENVGVFRLGETYNKGLWESQGKYIAILEGDDLWVPHKLEKQITALDADDSIVLAWAQAELVSGDLSVKYEIRPKYLSEYPALYRNEPPGAILELLSRKQFVPALTLVIRKSKLIEAGGFIQSHGMPLIDFPTVLKLSLLGKFYFEPEVLGYWRIYSTQTTKKHTVEIHNGFREFVKELLPQINWMSDEQKKRIYHYYDQLCLVAYARSGRYRLIRKEFKRSRKDYMKAITYPVSGKGMWRLRSLVGLTMSFFHLDVEWIAKLLGKKTYGS